MDVAPGGFLSSESTESSPSLSLILSKTSPIIYCRFEFFEDVKLSKSPAKFYDSWLRGRWIWAPSWLFLLCLSFEISIWLFTGWTLLLESILSSAVIIILTSSSFSFNGWPRETFFKSNFKDSLIGSFETRFDRCWIFFILKAFCFSPEGWGCGRMGISGPFLMILSSGLEPLPYFFFLS